MQMIQNISQIDEMPGEATGRGLESLNPKSGQRKVISSFHLLSGEELKCWAAHVYLVPAFLTDFARWCPSA